MADTMPPTPGTNALCAHTGLPPSVTVLAAAPMAVGTVTRARALGGMTMLMAYATRDADHADLTNPMGVSMVAFAQVRLASARPDGGVMTRSLHDRLPRALPSPARVE